MCLQPEKQQPMGSISGSGLDSWDAKGSTNDQNDNASAPTTGWITNSNLTSSTRNPLAGKSDQFKSKLI